MSGMTTEFEIIKYTDDLKGNLLKPVNLGL